MYIIVFEALSFETLVTKLCIQYKYITVLIGYIYRKATLSRLPRPGKLHGGGDT